jgi:hypothetical protein
MERNMADEQEKTTEANRRITPSERDESTEQLPEADDETTRANVRMARVLDDEGNQQVKPDPALQRSPD